MKLKQAIKLSKEKKLVTNDFHTNSWVKLSLALGLKQNTQTYACRAIVQYLTTGELSDYPTKEERFGDKLENKRKKKIARTGEESKEVSPYIQKKLDRQEFYQSREWRELRYLVLSHYKNACMCCGASPPDVVLHVDHIKPISLFPKLCLVFDNLQILCEQCNLGKSNLDMKDFRDAKFLKNT